MQACSEHQRRGGHGGHAQAYGAGLHKDLHPHACSFVRVGLILPCRLDFLLMGGGKQPLEVSTSREGLHSHSALKLRGRNESLGLAQCE